MGVYDFNFSNIDFNNISFDNMPKVKVKEILEFLVLMVYLEQLQLSKTEELINDKIKGICETENNKYSANEIISINDSIKRLLKILKRHEDMLESKIYLVSCILERYSAIKEKEEKE